MRSTHRKIWLARKHGKAIRVEVVAENLETGAREPTGGGFKVDSERVLKILSEDHGVDVEWPDE
ncbi:MAG: hypothetical protein QM723_19140 [Myxococcaceae bacterium]